MHIKTKAKYLKCKPLCIYNNKLVVNKGQSVFFFKDGYFKKIFDLPIKWHLRVLDNFSLIYRLRRSGIYSAVSFGNYLFFSFKKKLFCYNNLNKLEIISSFRKGNGPLSFTNIENISGFDDCLVYGDYFGNKNKDEINIYRLLKDTSPHNWEIVYKFETGIINHVHSLVPDINNKCIWILTGDFGKSASIWKIEDNFKSVVKIVSDHQKFRSCVAFSTPKGLLYATDSQLLRNSIRLLRKIDNTWITNSLFEINGSCIYGVELKDYFVFSTSTEPDLPRTRNGKLLALFDVKPGPGILINRSDIVVCNKINYKCQVIFSLEKDIYPYRLFQFGSIMFPKGLQDTNILYAYSVGNKKGDLSMHIFDLEDLNY